MLTLDGEIKYASSQGGCDIKVMKEVDPKDSF